MPIYEYRCAECGHVFEEIQRISDPDPDKCPQCDSQEVARLISQSAFLLRGGGWYAQNYDSSSSSSSSSKESPASTGAKESTTAAPKAAETTAKPAEK